MPTAIPDLTTTQAKVLASYLSPALHRMIFGGKNNSGRVSERTLVLLIRKGLLVFYKNGAVRVTALGREALSNNLDLLPTKVRAHLRKMS